MISGVCLVVKKCDEYLNEGLQFGPKESAWRYISRIAWVDAKDFGGSVFLRLPSWREIEASEKDF